MDENMKAKIEETAALIAKRFIPDVVEITGQMFPDVSLSDITEVVVGAIIREPEKYFMRRDLVNASYRADVMRLGEIYSIFEANFRTLTMGVYQGIVVTDFSNPMESFDEGYLAQLDSEQYADIENGLRVRIEHAMERGELFELFVLPKLGGLEDEIERLAEPTTVDAAVRYTLYIDNSLFTERPEGLSERVIDMARTTRAILDSLMKQSYYDRIASLVDDYVSQVDDAESHEDEDGLEFI